ncbi:hypothetical protein LINPERHAP2_LOCUS17117 [Linum perenne]
MLHSRLLEKDIQVLLPQPLALDCCHHRCLPRSWNEPNSSSSRLRFTPPRSSMSRRFFLFGFSLLMPQTQAWPPPLLSYDQP